MAFAAQQSGMTLREFALGVAQEVGVARLVGAGASSAVELPTGATLTRLLQACRAAWQRFVLEDNGWSFLTRDVVLVLSPDGKGPDCVGGDPGRIRLPNTIRSAPIGDWSLSLLAGQVWTVRATSTALVAEYRAASAGASAPVVAAVRAMENPDDQAGGAAWEVVIAPVPDLPYTMSGTFRMDTGWEGLDTRHIAGSENDYTLMRLGVWEYKRKDILPLAERAGLEREAEKMLAKSVKNDKDRRPTNLGICKPTGPGSDVDLPGPIAERSTATFIPPPGV